MYRVNAPAVYVEDVVAKNPAYMAKVERVVAALENPVEPVIYSEADLPGMVADGLLSLRGVMGKKETVPDPVLLFNTFKFDFDRKARLDRLAAAGLEKPERLDAVLGHMAFNWANYNKDGDHAKNDKVCRPCWRVHQQQGCLHKCSYCSLGGLLIVGVNTDEYCHWFGKLMDKHPWQLTYLLDDDADPPGLEPELGCLGELIEYFGTLDNRYLIIHTKTWNTEWMRDLKHNGNTILVWSVSGPTQSRLIEPNTGTTDERIEAARIAEEAGYQIRYKFKPIIPVKGWREDAAYTAKRIFEKTNPDVISLACFMWNHFRDLPGKLDMSLLDPEFMAAAEAAQEEMKDTLARPFPPEVRAEIYRHHLREIRKWNQDVPVSLSTENFSMWKEIGAEFGFKAGNYPCGCGPFTVPGAPTLGCNPFTTAERLDNGEIPCCLPPFPKA
jgi:DNA repair photolyase